MGKQSLTMRVSIHELVSKIQRGEIKLPEMQRPYVWKDEQVKGLLDSLYRNYPSGAILTWETVGEVATRDFSISQGKTESFQMLLDGQQRLTSLSAILLGIDIDVKKGKRTIDILFNLKHPEHKQTSTEIDDNIYNENEYSDTADASEGDSECPEQMTFAVKTNKLNAKPYWVSVTKVLNNSSRQILKDCGIDVNDPHYDKYADRLDKLRQIKEYMYDVHVLDKEKSLDEVTEIFVRINSRGTQLRSSDLALAQITAKWSNSLEIFEGFQQECKEKGFDLELGTFIKNLVIFATGQSKFNTVSSLSKERLEDGWERSKAGLQYALNFLEDNIGIDSPALLSTPFLILTLGYFASQNNFYLSTEMQKELRYWVLIANAKGRYSRGASETLLDQDIATIRKEQALLAMIKNLQTQFGRLDVLPDALAERDSRSPYFKTMFLIFKNDGAKDWRDGLGISLNHSGVAHKLQSHHIFPQDYLKGDFDTKKINDIANLSFISGRTNRKISNKPPSQYLPKIVKDQGKDALEKQCVPTDENLWELEKYDDFLQARRSLIAKKMNEFIGKSPLEKE